MTQVLCPSFIGRASERSTIRALLDGAAARSGGTVAIVGEQGVGKSRLLWEAAEAARSLDMTVLTGRGAALDRTKPFRPITEALFGHFRHQPVPDDPRLAPLRPVVGRLLSPWVPTSPQPVELSPLVVGEALVRLLSLVAANRACLLILDDLHWADVETIAVADYVAGNLTTAPVAFLAALRPGENEVLDSVVNSLHARRAITRLELDRLSDEEVRSMARTCFGNVDLTRELDELLRVRAGGLPFLVEELLSAVASGVKADRVAPASVEELVAQRLAALGPKAKELFAAAAVLGLRFDLALAAEAADVPLDDALRIGRAAVAQQLLVRDGDRDGALRFRHALTRDAVLGPLLAPERAALARRALAAVERRGTRAQGTVRLAADLAELAGERVCAAGYLLEAGRAAAAEGALGTARAALEQARSLCPSPGADPVLLAEIDAALVAVLARAGETDACLERGRALLASASLPEDVRAEIELELARVAAGAARWRAARDHVAGARTSLEGKPNPALEARIEAVAARVSAELGQAVDAERRARAALELGTGLAPDAACEALHVLGRQSRTRDLAEARGYFAEAEALASRVGLILERIVSLFELGTIDLLALGPRDRLEEALALAERTGALGTVVAAHLQLAWWWEDRGASPEMLAAACQARELATQLGMRAPAAMAAAAEAAASALAGDATAVEAAVNAAYDLAGDDPDVVAAARGHAQAMLALVVDDRAAALVELDAAVEALRSAGRATPMPMWGLRALLRAVEGTAAEPALDDAVAVQVHTLVAAYAELAQAVLAGRAGDPAAAEELFAAGDRRLAGLGWLQGLARRHVAEAALADGWGAPHSWLVESLPWVEASGARRVADAIRALIRAGGRRAPRSRGHRSLPEALSALHLTPREAEVLSFLGKGASTREIAEALYVSPKTVERHVENLVAKTGTGSRRRLVVFAAANTAPTPAPRNGGFPDAGGASSG